MSRNAWNLIKSSKGFNVSIYRHLCTGLLISMAFNVIGCIWISYVFLERPEHAYYSTNGASPPDLLAALEAPNYSDVPLLAGDDESAQNGTDLQTSVE